MRSHVQDIERSAEFAQAVPAGTSDFRTLIIDDSYGKKHQPESRRKWRNRSPCEGVA
jgi:hypothetical protein